MSTVPTETPPLVAAPVAANLEEDPGADIDYDAFVTKDDKPVDNIFVEKLQRLLTQTLYTSWPGPGEGRPFLVLTNVGWFYQLKTPAVVPDCLLSLGVTCPPDLHVKQGHSYYQWLMGKPPDVVIEAVSDRKGGEESFKKDLYASLGVPYYAVFDPKHFLSPDTLRTYGLVEGTYRLTDPGPWAKVGLGLRMWHGKFEGVEANWLRWCDVNGAIIPTGEEHARQADEHARQADERIRELEEELRRLKGEQPPDIRTR